MKPGGLKLSLEDGQSSSRSGMSLQDRMAEFRSDPDRMAEAKKFVDDVIRQAEAEAEAKKAQQKKQESTRSGLLGRRQSEVKSAQRVVTRARGVVVRWFESICNSTHTVISKRAFFKTRNNSAPPSGSSNNSKENNGGSQSFQK